VGLSREAEDNVNSRELHRIPPPAGAGEFQVAGLIPNRLHWCFLRWKKLSAYSNYCEQIFHKDDCRNVPPAQSPGPSTTFCSQYCLDIQLQITYTFFTRKQVLIKIKNIKFIAMLKNSGLTGTKV
jgi:hypothetical protein